MESFNRGAMFNQMGITTDPLFYEFPEEHAQKILEGPSGAEAAVAARAVMRGCNITTSSRRTGAAAQG